MCGWMDGWMDGWTEIEYICMYLVEFLHPYPPHCTQPLRQGLDTCTYVCTYSISYPPSQNHGTPSPPPHLIRHTSECIYTLYTLLYSTLHACMHGYIYSRRVHRYYLRTPNAVKPHICTVYTSTVCIGVYLYVCVWCVCSVEFWRVESSRVGSSI